MTSQSIRSSTNRPRKIARLAALSFASVLILFILTMAYVALIGVRIDAGMYRETISGLISEKLGRQIHFDGALQMEVSLHPALLIRQVRIAQPAGFGDADFLQLGELRIALDLIPLLSKKLHADELSGRDVRVLLQQRADGSNNWKFALPQSAEPEQKDDPASKTTPLVIEQAAARIDIKKIALTSVHVEYRGVNGKPQNFALDKFEATIPADAPIRASATGRVEETLGYKLAIDGGSLASLAAGQQPWPINIRLEFIDSVFTLHGNLGADASALRFGLGTPDLAKFGRLLEMDLPDTGAAGIGGLVRVGPGKISLTELSGILGKTALQGELGIDMTTERPRLSGTLLLPTVDLRPFIGQDDKDEEPPTDLRALYQSLSRAKFDLQQLNNYDIDIAMQVGQWLSLPGDIRDAGLRLKLEQGRLSLPIQATITGVPLKGEITADAARAKPVFRLNFGADNANIGGLAELLTGLPGIDGRLGRLKLNLAAEGNRGNELMRSLSVQLQLAKSQLSYGNVKDGKPVGFTVDKLNLTLAARTPLKGVLHGTLLGNPVDAELLGADLLSSMEKGSTAMEFNARSRGVRARITAELDAASATQKAEIIFSIGAEKAGEVASWFGLRAGVDAPLVFAGRASSTGESWKVSNLVFQLGRSNVYADLAQTEQNGRPHLSVNIDASNIDSAELDAMRPPAPPASAVVASRKTGAVLDIPILPQKLVLNDADVGVRVRAIEGAKIKLGDMRFDGRIRDGFMQTSPFHADIADTRFEGALMLDLRNESPRIQLWLSASDVNAGRIMQQLKLVDNFNARLDHVGLYLDSRSSQLSGLISNAQLNGQITGGKLVLQDRNTKSALTIAVRQGELSAAPGERIKLDVAGSIDAIPIDIAVRTATAKDLINPSMRVPFEIDVKAAQTALAVSGTLDRHIEARDLLLSLKVNGQRLNHLDKLLRVSLPPWGPWSVDGKFQLSNRGYEVKNLRLQVGNSVLNGQGMLATDSGKSKLDVVLAAPLIQLEDFRTQGWSATDGGAVAARPAETSSASEREDLRKKAAEASDQVQGMLSPALLRKVDATLKVDVDRVLSGTDQMGNGSLRARLSDGRAEIGPVMVTMPGGSAKWSLAYEPSERDVQADLKIDIDNFEYGILARQIKPEADLKGRFSLHFDVASRAPRLSEILKNGKGKIEFAVWPENLKAGVFDMWAVNVFVALLPTINPDSASKINCAIGRFTLTDGKLTQRQLVIDTTEMRVTGNTSINFAEDKLLMRLQPQAKTSQFLSLAIPIEVKGNFDKFSVGPNAGDVLQTVVRMATSIIWVPIKKLFEDKVPADGSDVCVFAGLQ